MRTDAERSGPAARWALPAAGALGLLVAVALGGGPPLAARLGAVVQTTALAGWAVGLWFLAAFGLGRVIRPWVHASPNAAALQLAAGVGLMLALAGTLGPLGWMNAAVCWGVTAVGVALALEQAFRARRTPRERPEPAHGLWALAWIAGGVLLLAAASPPGCLWASEFGQYDSLSYHLQLPQEWLRDGDTMPAAHNIYSFLPGFVETAFLWLAHLTLAPVDSPEGHGLLAGAGWRVWTTHLLPAGLTVLAAWLVARTVRALTGEDRRCPPAEALAGAAVLATPWVVVVGSISYNEAGVLALGAGAMLAAADTSLRPWVRGVLAGALVGAACGCKPTAIFLVAPAVGLVLLGRLPARDWARAVLPGMLAGAALLLPWMLRNAVASGNPVFPQARAVFGDGPWTAEQHDRYARAHRFDGSLADRLRTLAWTAPNTPPTAAPVERFRGAANPQWAALFPAGIAIGLAVVVALRTQRGVAGLLLAGLATQLVGWLALTHLQSRFLLPCVLTLAPLVGLGAALGRVGLTAGVVAVFVQLGALLTAYFREHDGAPNARLALGPGVETGRIWDDEVSPAIPTAWVHRFVPEGRTLALVGEATPLFYERRTIYSTTYDRSVLAEAVRTHPGDPAAWIEAFTNAGAGAVLVNLAELDRLRRSGWLDPALTPEAVDAFVRSLGPPAAVWRESGRAVWILPELPADERDENPGP
jgi:hypothetical protein